MKYLRDDLVCLLMAELGCDDKRARSLINVVLADLSQALIAGKRIVLADFGVMRTTVRNAHAHTHPYGHVLHIPAKRVVKFKAGKSLHEALQEGIEDDASQEDS